MAFWLFKEDPCCYQFEELEKDESTDWTGVSNNLAKKNLRQVREGDRIFFYATGAIKAVLGEMVAKEDAHPGSQDTASVSVTVGVVRKLATPVTLKDIKADSQLSSWDLVRLPRLSVMPVSKQQWSRVLELGKARQAAGK